ncbi:hypothetical protein GQ457_10G010380 [Hibiscus cannabinus]
MGLQAYKIFVKKNWIKLSRCSRTELALYSARSLGNHDASSATPTAAAIDQGLNKSSGEPTGCPRGSRPFSNVWKFKALDFQQVRKRIKMARSALKGLNPQPPPKSTPDPHQKRVYRSGRGILQSSQRG